MKFLILYNELLLLDNPGQVLLCIGDLVDSKPIEDSFREICQLPVATIKLVEHK